MPDNLKSAVTHPSYYEPDINRTFAAMAEHYHVAVLPARVKKARDKAKVENGVLQAQRRILASLRNRTFFSLAELNEAIREEAKKLNERPMTGIGKSRHDLFLEIDKPALRPLPEERYVITAWKKAKVHIDYHVDVEKTYYSVPYTLIGQKVDISYTSSIVEIYHRGTRVASHMRVNKPGAFVTDTRPHAARPPEVPRMDARADQVVGREDRSPYKDAHGGDHGAPGASGARLSKLSRPRKAREALSPGTGGAGMQTGVRTSGVQLQKRQIPSGAGTGECGPRDETERSSPSMTT